VKVKGSRNVSAAKTLYNQATGGRINFKLSGDFYRGALSK